MADRTFLEECYCDVISGVVDDTYDIPNGTSLVVTQIEASSALSLGNFVSTKIELFYDVNGDGSNLQLISVLFVTSSHITKEIAKVMVGNGTAKLRVRRTPIDLGSREISVKWEGYLESNG